MNPSRNHSCISLACVTLLLLASAGAQAQPPATAPAKTPSLSPEMEAALAQLNADSFEDRQKAVEAIQQAYAAQLKRLLVLDDPEAQARIAAVTEYNDALCRWALDALKMPQEQRKKYVAWSLSPEIAPIVAKVYSTSVERRVEGVKGLADVKSDQVATLLARLMNDDSREVYVAAMDAAWDHPATPEMIDALWSRAVDAGLAVYQPRVFNQPTANNPIKFRGRLLGTSAIYNPYSKFTDNDIATDLLIQLNDPHVAARLKAFFDKLQTDPNATLSRNFLLLCNEQPMKNMYRLLEHYNVKSAVPFLADVALHAVQRPVNNFGNQGPFWSNRTAVLATVVKMTNQDLDDYQLKRSPQMNNMWLAPSEAAENDSVKKFEQWWNQHKSEYAADPAATQPATPATLAAPHNPPRPLGAAPQPMQLQAQQIQINGGIGVNGIITITGNGQGQVIIQQQPAPPPPAPPPEKPVDAPRK